MALSAIAWTAVILVVVFLSLTFAPNWCLAILILVGNIAKKFDNITAPGDGGGDGVGGGDGGGGDGGGGGGRGRGRSEGLDERVLQDNGTPTNDEENQLPDTTTDQSYHSGRSEDSAADAPAATGEAAGSTRSELELSSTSSSSYAFTNGVYLNFRGQDTGHKFIDILNQRLVAEGISVSRAGTGETSLKVNEDIKDVIKDIKQSRISIAVLSKNYASSKLCLWELVEMLECKELNGQIIIPIFYDVSPEEVKDLTGDFGRSFDRHVKDEVGSDTIETWKEVLRKIGDLSEYHPEGNDGELVNKVVTHVAQLLKREDQVVTDKPIGIDLHVQEIMRRLGVAYGEGRAVEVRGEEVRVVGIWGVPGVGKTRLAHIVFDKISHLFDASIFLKDICWNELSSLRHNLIGELLFKRLARLESSIEGIEEIESLCCKAKVLIVLDDVDKDEEIRELAGKLTWFGPGSRIIVTTDKREVLRAFDVDNRGTVEEYGVKLVDRGAPRPAGDALAPTGEKGRSAASSSTPSSSSSSSSSGIKYEVFLNFRPTDIPTAITDHLYKALTDAGISVFREDAKLHRKVALAEPIKQSRVWIVILSTDYASDEWCLLKLQQMWEWRESKKQAIIPIFYDVRPSDVRHQTLGSGDAFPVPEGSETSETIEKYRKILGDIAALPGYSGKSYEGYESQLAEKVVLRVAWILRDDGLPVTGKLFGIESHVQEMKRKLGIAQSEGRATEVRGEDVGIVGICGVPGVGKTTLAKVIYNEVRTLFEACSFLEGIRARGERVSQQLLIADLLNLEPAQVESVDLEIKTKASQFKKKQVFIVLDDVEGDEQIKAVVGELTWFGSGSRIIVTTRNEKILSAFDVGSDGRVTVEEHKIETMSCPDALKLLRYHASEERSYYIGEDVEYPTLSRHIVKAIGGVPKDIVHYASALNGCRIHSWRDTLRTLQESLQEPRKIGTAQVSYAGGSELEYSSEDEQTDSEDMD